MKFNYEDLRGGKPNKKKNIDNKKFYEILGV
jgi:hypothetical protein